MQKLVSFREFVFVVPKLLAHKMVITSNFVLQTTLINFQKLQPKTNQTKKLKKNQNMKNCTILSPKTKNDLLTLN